MKTRCAFGFVILLAFVSCGVTYGQQPKPPRAGSKLSIITYELPSWGNGAPRLLIEVPEGVKVRLTNEVDFDVYSIASSEDDRSAKIGIYLGHHASTNFPANASKRSGMIDSVPVIWRNWREEKDGKAVHHSEALIENFFPCGQPDKSPAPSAAAKQAPPNADCGLQMHVFIEANQPEDIDRMVSWIGTLRKKS